jgi:hypothetical protein
MFEFTWKKQDWPFAKLFKSVTPKDFVAIFNSDLAQTKAFILSFSPRKSYVKKVIRILDVQESDENNLTGKSSFIIREYLNQCHEDNFDLSFVLTVENEIETMITEYKNTRNFCNLRKKFHFKHPA